MAHHTPTPPSAEPELDAATRNGRHRAANFALVPFAARLFAPPGSEPLPAVAAPLPLGDPNALTAEAVGALQSIFRDAALSFLLRERGARALALPAEDGERIVERRAWSPDAWGGMALRFTSASVDLLLAAYTLTRRPKPSEEESDVALSLLGSTPFEANGDLILHFLAWRRLREANQPADALQRFSRNPLAGIERCVEFAASASKEGPERPLAFASLAERLFAPDLSPALPWIAASWPRLWLGEEDRRWTGGLAGFAQAGEALSEALGAWIASAAGRGRVDLLLPVLDFYGLLYPNDDAAERDLDRFAALVDDLRVADKQEVAGRWEASLTPTALLRDVRDRARATHPIDRTAAEKILLRGWIEREFDAVADRIDRLAASAKRPFIASADDIASKNAGPTSASPPSHEPVLPR